MGWVGEMFCGRPLKGVSVSVSTAVLRVETVSFDSVVRIQSDVSRHFLCFNKRARLTVRVRTPLRHRDLQRRFVFRLKTTQRLT